MSFGAFVMRNRYKNESRVASNRMIHGRSRPERVATPSAARRALRSATIRRVNNERERNEEPAFLFCFYDHLHAPEVDNRETPYRTNSFLSPVGVLHAALNPVSGGGRFPV